MVATPGGAGGAADMRVLLGPGWGGAGGGGGAGTLVGERTLAGPAAPLASAPGGAGGADGVEPTEEGPLGPPPLSPTNVRAGAVSTCGSARSTGASGLVDTRDAPAGGACGAAWATDFSWPRPRRPSPCRCRACRRPQAWSVAPELGPWTLLPREQRRRAPSLQSAAVRRGPGVAGGPWRGSQLQKGARRAGSREAPKGTPHAWEAARAEATGRGARLEARHDPSRSSWGRPWRSRAWEGPRGCLWPWAWPNSSGAGAAAPRREPSRPSSFCRGPRKYRGPHPCSRLPSRTPHAASSAPNCGAHCRLVLLERLV
jgi:hypothetical protein